MIATILTYVGTLLVAFEIVAKFGHILSLPGLALFKPIVRPLLTNKTSYKTWLLLPLLFIFGIISIIFMSITIVISMPPHEANKLLNRIYKKQKAPLNPIAAEYVKKKLPNVPDEKVNKALEEMQIPFVAIIGIIVLTVGFILDIKG